MASSKLNLVTGAFSYSGKYITQKLLDEGQRVITLTGHPNRPDPFGGQVKTYPFNFDDHHAMVDNLQGVETLYNTYWVRFDHGDTTYSKAVENTRNLISGAEQAGVGRIVHISITQPDSKSPLPYFRGKGILEQDIKKSSMSYAILRPTVIFGREDILINNIAWFLHRFPIFAIPGDGTYKLQPIYVKDLAALAVQAGNDMGNIIIDSTGPETYTFNQLIDLLSDAVGSRTRILHLPPSFALWISKIIGKFLGDVVLTSEEITGLMDNLLVSDAPPPGKTLLSQWVKQNASSLGVHYASELNRHYEISRTT
jgi:NADH dehydrogenase